jgi:Protein of unknown function (DUF3551)
MRRPIMLAAAVAAMSGAAVGSAKAQGTYWPWCVDYNDGSYNCGFANYQQCLATAIRRRGLCRPNPLPPGYGERPRGNARARQH